MTDANGNHRAGEDRLRPMKPQDTVHGLEVVRSGEKQFHITFRENARGRCLRVTESANDRHNTIIIPEDAITEFLEAVGKVVS